MSRSFSYWEYKHFFSEIDYCIIGSGIVGLNAGIKLLELNPQARVLILERSSIPYGSSTRNAGFACFGSASELIEDLKNNSEEEVFGLFRTRYNGIETLLKRINPEKIIYRQFGGHEVFDDSSMIHENELSRLNEKIHSYTGLENYYSFQNQKLKEAQLNGFKQLVYNLYEACIDPMLMINELLLKFQSLGGRVLPSTEMSSWIENKDHIEIKSFDQFTFHCKKIIFAVNGFAHHFFPEMDTRPARNTVLVIKPKTVLKLQGCYHFNQGYVYFRNIDGNLLIGGGRNIDLESEYTDSMESNPRIKNYLLEFVKNHILTGQEFNIIHQWSGILGVGSKHTPIVEAISPRTFVAVRLSGIGIATGSLVGNQVAELAMDCQGDEN